MFSTKRNTSQLAGLSSSLRASLIQQSNTDFVLRTQNNLKKCTFLFHVEHFRTHLPGSCENQAKFLTNPINLVAAFVKQHYFKALITHKNCQEQPSLIINAPTKESASLFCFCNGRAHFIKSKARRIKKQWSGVKGTKRSTWNHRLSSRRSFCISSFYELLKKERI